MNKKRLLTVMGSTTITLPQKLIITPATILEDFESTTGWAALDSSLALNASEVYYGSNSIKMTVNAGATGYMTKFENWNLASNYKSLVSRAYIHTAPSTFDTETMSILIYLSNEAGFTNYATTGYRTTTNGALDNWKQGQWNTLQLGLFTWTNQAGSFTFNNPIGNYRYRFVGADGQSPAISFDKTEVGLYQRPVVMFMFDDGWESAYTKALPILQKNDMVGNLYIVQDYIGSPGFLTELQLLEMNNKGWGIANHTKTHRNLNTLAEAEIITEVQSCQAYLEGLGLTRCSLDFVYPIEYPVQATVDAVKMAGILSGFSSYNLPTRMEYTNRYLGTRVGLPFSTNLATAKSYVDEAILYGYTLAFNLHTLVDSGASTNIEWNVDDFDELCTYIKSKGVITLAIDEYRRLYDGGIRISHH